LLRASPLRASFHTSPQSAQRQYDSTDATLELVEMERPRQVGQMDGATTPAVDSFGGFPQMVISHSEHFRMDDVRRADERRHQFEPERRGASPVDDGRAMPGISGVKRV
jgi:hypothetical protein